MINDIMAKLNNIQYRWIDDASFIYDADEVMKYRCGNCWEQVELERQLFLDAGINSESYFVSLSDENGDFQTHTFLVLEIDSKFIWVEHSWDLYKGIYEYESLNTLLNDVKENLISDFKSEGEVYAFVYKYQKPQVKMRAPEFLDYCMSSELIKLNEPLYFYHVVDKDADLNVGILSLKYMYNHKMYELFDKYADKYKYRIVNSWNLDKYKGMPEDSLTREDIIQALELYRGEYGPSSIYFFRYPLYPELGKRIEDLLKHKDIIRININDEEVQLLINDIFYGYKVDSNEMLTKEYYENVSQDEYFTNFDDNDEMYFKNINHISVSFKDDYLPSNFIEKC